MSGPSRTFVFDRQLLHPVQGYTKGSTFVLYDNGAFVLQYVGFEYRGGYAETGGDITFGFEGGGESWATAKLEGDTLTVRYSFSMLLSDFEDAVYVRVR